MYVVVALPQKRPAIHERESPQGWCGLRAGTAENTAATPHALLGHGDRRCSRRRRSAVYLCRLRSATTFLYLYLPTSKK